MGWGKLIGAGLLVLSAASVQAQEADERHADLIHADLPLYGNQDAKWPRAFQSDDDFGCASRVRFGDWAFREIGREAEDQSWYRFSNYGVFHCFAMVMQAEERDELNDAPARYAFFVPIGEARIDGRKIELWALQTGGRPGSEYLLLAREPDKEVTQFTVLQRKCPRANVRDSGGIDILMTRYCAINSKGEMVALARAMARLEPLGTLTLVKEEADDSAPKAESSKP